MKLIRNLSLGVLLMWILDGCFTAPEYPTTPQVEFNDIYFGKGVGSSAFDSIVVSLKFKDGDGDLGLSDSYDTDPKFALQSYFTFQAKPVSYNTRRLNPTLVGTNGKPLPAFVTPYNCTNWEVQYKIVNKISVPTDTLYIELNPNYYNISIKFIADGVYFDPSKIFLYPNCQPQGYNGRFPVLSVDPGKKAPLDGKIMYSIKSSAFDLYFTGKQLQLKIAIQDRALHKSDTLTTPSFTLESIRR